MKKPEETAEDKALGRIVAAKLREQLRPADSGCPETETLAALYDRALTDRERAVCENHLLTCLRCQEFMAELARLSDPDEPHPVLGEAASVAEQVEGAGWHFRLAWVMPFLIIAIGSAIWFREDIQKLLQQRQEVAMNVPEPAPGPETPAESRERDAGEKQEAAKTATLKDLAKSPPQPVSQPRPAESALAPRQAAASAPTSVGGTAGAAGAIAPPSARADLRASGKLTERSLAMVREENKAKAADRAAAPAQATTAQDAALGSTFARKEASQLGGVTIRGGQAKFAPKWRVSTLGTIQKADEFGGWVRVPTGVDADLFDITFAGSAGWAVGYEGTVLRSTDGGNSWNKVTAPSSEDLIRVSAQSAEEARVISRSGESFHTTDGGRTWK